MYLLTKKSTETLQNVGIDFSNRLLTGEVIDSSTVTCTTAGIVSGATNSTTQVTADLAAGTDNGEYSIVYTATGDSGSILVGYILLGVKDGI